MKRIYKDYFEFNFSLDIKFDGIITDPPYKGCIRNKLGEQDFSFLKFLKKADKETKNNSFLIIFSNLLCASDLIHVTKKRDNKGNEIVNWKYKTHQIWDKQPYRTWISWGHPLRHTEYILYFTKGNFQFSFKNGKVKKPYKRKSFGGKLKNTSPNGNKKSYGMYKEIIKGFRYSKNRTHPTAKPKEFSVYFKSIIDLNDPFVLDPFMGTGNLISAFNKSIGVDIKNWK